MRTNALLRILAGAMVFVAGCGTIVHGPEQKITVQSRPTGADVIHDGSQRGVTPTTISLSRRASETIVVVRKSGYADAEIYMKNGVSAWALFGNILTLGIGWIVDASTGSFGAYPQEVYTVDLQPVGTSSGTTIRSTTIEERR